MSNAKHAPFRMYTNDYIRNFLNEYLILILKTNIKVKEKKRWYGKSLDNLLNTTKQKRNLSKLKLNF